jgi:Xaa-Pro aminopeptidase
MAFHEPYPLLKPASADVLEPGMVVAIEPGVYIPGVGGVRNEDDCLVGSPEGASSLQVTPHSSSGRTLASVA